MKQLVTSMILVVAVLVGSRAMAFETEKNEDVSVSSLVCLHRQANGEKVSVSFDDCRAGDTVRVRLELVSDWPLVVVHATIADGETLEIFAWAVPKQIKTEVGGRQIEVTLRTKRGPAWPRRLADPKLFVKVNDLPFGRSLSEDEVPISSLE